MRALLRQEKVQVAAACAVAVLFLSLAVAVALTERPRVDEGFFANPALNLIRTGVMGTTTIETAGTNLDSMKRHTYWVMPLHLVLQAAWYEVFGFGLFRMRAISMVFGLIALVSWFVIVERLGGDRRLALLASALTAFDYVFVTVGADGRMDMMSASLGFASYAVYLRLRERGLTSAVLLSQSLTVAAGLTHPNGGTVAFVGLLFLTLYFDRERLAWKHVMAACVPYLVGALGWGFYISRDPAAFLPQFTNNATMNNRMGGLTNPLRALLDEVTIRYPTVFGLARHSVGRTGPIYLKSLVLVGYLVGVFGVLLVRPLRRRANLRVLLVLLALAFVIVAILDGQKNSYNMIYVVPYYATLLAAFAWWCWMQRRVPRILIALALACLVMLQVGGLLYRARQNTYANGYAPVINYLRSNGAPSRVVMGGSGLGFGLGFPDTLVDDIKLGYHSGRRADFVVIDPEYDTAMNASRGRQPAIDEHVARVLTEEYRKVFEQGGYRIYERR
jgi:uncharacterized membrane protein